MLKEQATGLVKRLLPSNTPIKVFATYRHSDEVCGIAFSYSENLKVSIDSFLNLKELYVQLYLDAFSAYPIQTQIPSGAPGGTTGKPEVCPSRSSRTSDGTTQNSHAHDR